MKSVAEVMPVAVYQGPGVVEVQDRPTPAPGPDQVLVEVDHCGICGSDIHLMLEGWGQPGSIFGHEFSGTVVAVGSKVTQWAPGERVVGGPSPRCGKCQRCREGKPSQCERRRTSVVGGNDGAFARYIVVNSAACLRLPEKLAARDAALAEPLAVALHGIKRGQVNAAHSVMVLGAGPIGALSIAVLKTMGVRSIVVVEPGAKRQELARQLGADEVVNPADLEVFPRWEPERLAAHPVDVVLECSGKKEAVVAGLCQLRRGGQLVLVGAGNQLVELDPNRMILNELHLCGSFVYDDDGFDRALELLADGSIPTESLIDERDVPLDSIETALQQLADGQIAGKAMVVPRRSVEPVPS